MEREANQAPSGEVWDSGGQTSRAAGEPLSGQESAEAPVFGGIVSIEGEMTLRRAPQLRALLLGLLARDEQEVQLDLSGVSEIDSAGLQLLLLTKRTALARHKQLLLLGKSAAVSDALELLRLTSYFGEPVFGLFVDEDTP
jgi:anti-sigma B factor antagonist